MPKDGRANGGRITAIVAVVTFTVGIGMGVLGNSVRSYASFVTLERYTTDQKRLEDSIKMLHTKVDELLKRRQ